MPVLQVRHREHDDGDSERTREMDLCLCPCGEALAIGSLSITKQLEQDPATTIEILTWDQAQARSRQVVDGIVRHFQTC
jgi:hypothetical protein